VNANVLPHAFTGLRVAGNAMCGCESARRNQDSSTVAGSRHDEPAISGSS